MIRDEVKCLYIKHGIDIGASCPKLVLQRWYLDRLLLLYKSTRLVPKLASSPTEKTELVKSIHSFLDPGMRKVLNLISYLVIQ